MGCGTGILSATQIFCISTADENMKIKLQEKQGRLDCGNLSQNIFIVQQENKKKKKKKKT